MKIVEECYGKIKFQVKIKNKYITVATLQAGWRKCETIYKWCPMCGAKCGRRNL